MPKKKLSNRMTPFQRKKLYAELARYKSGAPINDLAKRHGVSTGTVNHWWKRVKADRRHAIATPTPFSTHKPYVASNWTDETGLPKPASYRIDIEAIVRDTTRRYLDEAFRKA